MRALPGLWLMRRRFSGKMQEGEKSVLTLRGRVEYHPLALF